MTLNAVITDTTLKPYTATIAIYDEKNNFKEGFYLTQIIDMRSKGIKK